MAGEEVLVKKAGLHKTKCVTRNWWFSFGSGKEETARRFLKDNNEPFVLGFCQGRQWFVFADKVAKETYKDLSFGPKLKAFENALKQLSSAQLKADLSKDKLTSAVPVADMKSVPNTKEAGHVQGKQIPSSTLKDFKSLLDKAGEAAKASAITVNEDSLRAQILRELNTCVMHELAIHKAGGLSHTPMIASIELSGTGLDTATIYSLIGKKGPKTMIFTDQKGERVRKLYFENAEKQARKIKGVLKRVKVENPHLKVGYTSKNYPVEFGLDDVKILAPGQETL